MDLTGKLLVAPPSIRGTFWSKSVIFITEHHSRGSMGLIINKRSKMPITEFSRQVGIETNIDGFLHIGGPVNIKALTLLHSSEWACSNTMNIDNQFSISSSQDLLFRLSTGDRPQWYRMILGLCAWSPEQLENEIKGNDPYQHNNSWLLATPSTNFIFNLDESEQWTQGIEQSGMEFVSSLLA